METLGDVGHLESHFGLEIVLVLVQDRCTVGAKCTIGLEIVSVRLEIVLILIQDRCTVCGKSTIGSEIVLDAPDGTPWGCGSFGISF
jgi:hypothetical protein